MFVQTTREAIAAGHARGFSQPEIARELDLAPTTVSYHLGRIPQSIPASADDRPQPASQRPRTREMVAVLIADGVPHVEIARTLGISKSTVSYHAGRLGTDRQEKYGVRYDWKAIQRYYDQGHSVRDCMKAFGFSSASWSEAVKRGAIAARPSATPISVLLVAGTYRGRDNLKMRLTKEGLKDGSCERCGMRDWRGKPVSMALHHINGDRLDNRLDNLELLCPNCHSQTDTYSGRNGHRRRSPGPEPGASPAQIDAKSVDVSANSSTRSAMSA
ncbi:MAG TPA: helix-turn-helix domain-containing protein [Solirubrobacteraceae bacterium]|jgi:DNA-binding CsgD family transcriptional regulator/5-methylcytosine-specific restriction endonuclease McrA